MRKRIRSMALVLILCLVAVAFLSPSAWGQRGRGAEEVIFDNGNIYAVQNEPAGPTTFTLQERYQITRITNYHWNNEEGADPGVISIRDAEGNIVGRWQTSSRPGQGGVPDAFWDAYPNITLSPGRYTIVDSDTSTWSCNQENDNRGMSQVYGYPK